MVLVVDDDDAARGFLIHGLERAGYAVLEAADGQFALEILKQKRDAIHLVVTDIRMPRMDGYQLAEWMAVWDFQQPLIFMTGYEQPIRGLPGPVLHKPISTDDLLAQVRRSLRQVGIRPVDLGARRAVGS